MHGVTYANKGRALLSFTFSPSTKSYWTLLLTGMTGIFPCTLNTTQGKLVFTHLCGWLAEEEEGSERLVMEKGKENAWRGKQFRAITV